MSSKLCFCVTKTLGLTAENPPPDWLLHRVQLVAYCSKLILYAVSGQGALACDGFSGGLVQRFVYPFTHGHS